MFGLHILGFSSRRKFRTQFKRKHHSKGILMNDLPVWDSHNVPVPELDTQPASWKTPKELRKERTEAGQIWHSNVKKEEFQEQWTMAKLRNAKQQTGISLGIAIYFWLEIWRTFCTWQLRGRPIFIQNLHKMTLKSEREVRFNCVERHPAFIYWAIRQLIDLEQQYKQPISRSRLCVKVTLLLPSRKSKLDPNQVSQI